MQEFDRAGVPLLPSVKLNTPTTTRGSWKRIEAAKGKARHAFALSACFPSFHLQEIVVAKHLSRASWTRLLSTRKKVVLEREKANQDRHQDRDTGKLVVWPGRAERVLLRRVWWYSDSMRNVSTRAYVKPKAAKSFKIKR